MSKFCGNCGSEIPDGVKFCSSCGTAVTEDESANGSQTPENPVPVTPVTNHAENNGGGAATTYEQPAPESAPTENGSPISRFSNAASAAAANVAAKKNGKNLTPIIIAAVAIVAVIIILVVVISRLTRFEKIDAKDLFDVDFVGPDGYGVCYAQLDIDPSFAYSEYDVEMSDYSISYNGESSDDVSYSKYFSDKRSTLEKAYSKASSKKEAKEMRDALLKTNTKTDEFKLTCEASKTSGLKNGDKVTITVDFDEDYLKEHDIKLENTEFEVEVKGLETAETVDPFADFNPTFSGVDGNGSIDTYNSYSTEYPFVYYYVSSYTSYYLSNDDTVEFTAELEGVYDKMNIDDNDASKGYWFKYDGKYYVWAYEETSTSKEFTVTGLTPLEEVDPFEGMTFETSGATPFLKVTDVILSDDLSDIADDISVSLADWGEKLNVGDTFTVKCYAYSSLASAGYKIAGTADSDGYYTKEFTVEEGTYPKYVTTTDAAAADEALTSNYQNAVIDARQDIQGTQYFSGFYFDEDVKSIKSFDKVDTYITVNQSTDYDNYGWSEIYNEITRLYKATVTLENDGGTKTLYVAISYDDIIGENGTYTCENDASTKIYETSDDAMSAIKDREGFTTTSISDIDTTADSEEATSEAVTTSTTDSSSTADSNSTADSSSTTDSSSVVDSSSASDSTASTSDDEEDIPTDEAVTP